MLDAGSRLEWDKKIIEESSVEVHFELLHDNPAETLNEYANPHKPDLLVSGANRLCLNSPILDARC